MRRALFFFFFVGAMLSLPSFAKQFTQGFRIAKLQLDFPFQPDWEVALDPFVHEILRQKYTFIGKGAQSYVFESQDGKYVVKLFRYDHPLSEEKIVHVFNACKMAYDRLREETGLIYIHLNPTSIGLPVLNCKDAVGRSYELALDQTRFAIQKKAQDFRKTFQKAKQNPAEMQRRLDEFIHLLQSRTDKEILNSDPNLSRNFGFLETRAIEFDFGNFRYAPGLDKRSEIQHYAQKLRHWLKKNAPEWVSYLDQQLESPR